MSAYSNYYQRLILSWRSFSALMMLVWQQEKHPACKKTEWWGAGVVFCWRKVQRLAYSLADATVTYCILLLLYPD